MSCVEWAPIFVCAKLLVLDPNSHTRVEVGRLSKWVEAQAQRIAVMIADHPLAVREPAVLTFSLKSATSAVRRASSVR
jgi:hypothetical protein